MFTRTSFTIVEYVCAHETIITINALCWSHSYTTRLNLLSLTELCQCWSVFNGPRKIGKFDIDIMLQRLFVWLRSLVIQILIGSRPPSYLDGTVLRIFGLSLCIHSSSYISHISSPHCTFSSSQRLHAVWDATTEFVRVIVTTVCYLEYHKQHPAMLLVADHLLCT